MSTDGVSLHHAQFRQELAAQIDRIKRLCAKWGVPELGSRVTLILRDPTNDAMSVVLTDEPTLAEAYRVAHLLEQQEKGP